MTAPKKYLLDTNAVARLKAVKRRLENRRIVTGSRRRRQIPVGV